MGEKIPHKIETRVGYQAVFYSGDEKIESSKLKQTYEEAEKEIKKRTEDYKMFKYTPWSRTEIEEVKYRLF